MRILRLAAVVAVAVAGLTPTSAAAFTLIQPVIKLYVNPSAGYTTSLVQVRGTMTFPGGPCTATPETFNFTFDSKALWSKTVASCNASTKLWDTGWSPYKVPPVPRTVGNHSIALTVGTVTVKYTYAIYAVPSTRTSPSPAPSPSAGASQTPGASPCPVAAAVPPPPPPPGTGGFVDNLIAGAMVAAVLPILGLALFGPSQVLAAVGRRRRVLGLLGLGLLLAATLSSPALPAHRASPRWPPSRLHPSQRRVRAPAPARPAKCRC